MRLVALALLLLPAAATAGTIHVAASGSHPTIQSGIDAATPGDRVRVEPGNYAEVLTIPSGLNGLRVEADGEVIVDARGPSGAGLGPALRVDSNDVTIEGLVLRNASSDVILDEPGVGVLAMVNGLTLDRVEILRCVDGGVRIQGDNARIVGCVFRGNGRPGSTGSIVIVGNASRVEDTKIQNAPRDAIEISGKKAVVRGCAISVVQGRGIQVEGAKARVTDNRVDAVNSHGIFVSGADARVSENHVRLCGGLGVWILGERALVRKNVVCRTTKSGILAFGSGAIVEDNRVEQSFESGLLVTGAGSVIRDNEVGAARFVQIDCAGDDLTVVGNKARAGMSPKSTGIAVHGEDIGSLVANNVSLDQFAGFELKASQSELRGNVARRCVRGFVIGGSGQRLEDNLAEQGRDGFRVSGDGHVLLENESRDNLDDGFAVDLGTGSALKRNAAKRNGGEGFENRGADTALKDNVASGNRIDIANTGSFSVFKGNEFETGGPTTLPELQ